MTKQASPTTAEPRTTLPTARLLASVLIPPALVGAGWFAACMIGPWSIAAGVAGLVGGALVALVALGVVLAIGPWREREISMWMTLWLAGIILRLFVTPALTFLLYSAAALDSEALALSVGFAYLATLFSEAIVLSMYLRRVT